MTFEKDKVYQMKVKRTDFFNGRRAYIAEYEGAEYRINMYAHQSPDKTELSWAHLQTSVEGYPKTLHSLNIKNGRSDTPLS